MQFYDLAFLSLIAGCGVLSYQQYRKSDGESAPEEKSLTQNTVTPRAKAEAAQFTRLFLAVYCLVMASDWLQGPYVYSLYKDQFNLEERIVGLLFVTGFISGAISGYYVGQFADKHGRKTACLIFCITYSLGCFSTLVPSLPVLFCGRVLGGLSTSIMYSCFEGWMVTEYHKRHLDEAGMSLSGLFGIMTTMNSVVAIVAGVFSEWLVRMTNTKRAPFMASAGLLSIAFWLILAYWTENYGDSHTEDATSSKSSSATVPAKNALKTIISDKRILTLGLASCFFEGSMYLFVFFWTPALKAARGEASPLPLGMIFACFMASVMLGSLLFNLLITKYALLTPLTLLTIIFALSSSALVVTITLKSEILTFWCFCLFEMCVGMYFPSMGTLKGRFVEDGVRARVYGILRIPLNIFVVVALSLMKEGEVYRNQVFLTCGGLLVVTSGIFHWIVQE
ncbi:putative major facilitator superfamily-containing protein 5 [Venustampulla echinocandica]|uniref:Molybdate-anion transporter n=1 Tax=Venustampulla echinocandica TaxID=2656787 RepID=A0A370TNV1_9HELO|nr:putative major facilitator superfamily-containing protein 5 [Venustampulla echinocandica]RDL37202.1 putative major facilitator superfamily-containing protein 5 [Venustampulla echinocandica]